MAYLKLLLVILNLAMLEATSINQQQLIPNGQQNLSLFNQGKFIFKTLDVFLKSNGGFIQEVFAMDQTKLKNIFKGSYNILITNTLYNLKLLL